MSHLFSSEGLFCIQRLAASSSILVFDFDGTLAPIVPHFYDAKVPPPIVAQLQILSRSWPIAIVTGRSVQDVKKKLAFMPDYLFGNHGAERADQSVSHQLNEELNHCRDFLSTHAFLLAARKVSVEDKGMSLALHYRQSDNPIGTRAWLHELMWSASEKIVVSDGHMVVNILLMHAPDKGDALQTILHESGVVNALVVGDDENDEAAFSKAPEHAVTVRIGSPAVCSQARFRLSGQYQVGAMLDILQSHRH